MHQPYVRFYRICDAFLQHKAFQDDPQAKMTTGEVLLTALVAAFFFGNNLRLACQAVVESGLVPVMLSESRFNRRWHKIKDTFWQEVLSWLHQQNPADTYLIDSCPMPVCHNQRAKHSRLYQDPAGAYWGYCAAKEEYYYGLKAHVLTTASGRAVEVVLLCGCSGDLTGMKERTLPLPAGARLYADKAYTDYAWEEALEAQRQITFLPLRKSNHTRQHPPKIAKAVRYKRKRIETTFSQVTAKLPRRVHAVRPSAFERKVLALFVAFALYCVEKDKRADKRRAAS